jgi:hypothetical protein
LKLQADGSRLATWRCDLNRGQVRVMIDARKNRPVRLPIRKLHDDATSSLAEQVSTRQHKPALTIRSNIDERAAADVG